MEPKQGSPATPVSTASNNNNVVELRNPREISRAVLYTEAELATNLELGTADTESKRLLAETVLKLVKAICLGQDNGELSKATDELFVAIAELDQAAADLIAGAEAQVAELAEQLEQSQAGSLTQSQAMLEQISAELQRREQWSDAARNIQEQFENQRDQMQGQLTTATQLLNFGASDDEEATTPKKTRLEREIGNLERVINTIIEVLAANDREMSVLLAYQVAVDLVTAGPPVDLIGKALPAVPTVAAIKNPHDQ